MDPLARETQNKAETVRLMQDHIDSLTAYGKVEPAVIESLQSELDEFKAA